jgi:hypothetical protein
VALRRGHVGASVSHGGNGARVGANVGGRVVGDNVSHEPHNSRQTLKIVVLLQLANDSGAHEGGSGEHGNGVGSDVGARVGASVGTAVGVVGANVGAAVS